MARKSEHKISRKLYNYDQSHNCITATDAMFKSYMSLLQDPLITESITYQNYQKLLPDCENKKRLLLEHHANIRKGLPHSSLTEEYLHSNIHSKLECKENPLRYSIIDIEIFLANQINFPFTSKSKISNIFDINLIDKDLGITTFKDNANDSRSDKIVLFNLAMLLIVNKTSDTPFPYPILNECYANELNYSETFSEPTKELIFLYNTLSQMDFKRTYNLLSKECILLFLADKSMYPLQNYDQFCKIAIEYLEYERKFFLTNLKLQKYDFIKSFLSLIGIVADNDKLKWSTQIRKYYNDVINDFKSLRSEIDTRSTELFDTYCQALPALLNIDNYIDDLSLDNALQETAHFVSDVLKECCIEDKSLLYTRYVTILSNLTHTNDLYRFIELLYNICVPDDDNITDLAINIFTREYNPTVLEYLYVPENELINLLNVCHCSLSMAEDIMLFFSNYICNENDWEFVCSLLTCQNNNPDWFNRFYDIIRNVRGASFKDFNSILKECW